MHPALDPPCWTLLRYFHLTPQVHSPLLPQTPTRFVLRFVTLFWFREELGIEAGRFFSAPTAIAPFVARVVGDHSGKRVGSLYPLAETFRLNVPWRTLVVPAVPGTLVGWGKSAKYREWCGVGECLCLSSSSQREGGGMHTHHVHLLRLRFGVRFCARRPSTIYQLSSQQRMLLANVRKPPAFVSPPAKGEFSAYFHPTKLLILSKNRATLLGLLFPLQ